MNTSLVKVMSIAGIFHDIGKFAERAGDIEEVNKDEVHQDYRYCHAYYTEKTLEEIFGERASWSPDGLETITVLNLASRHHKPRNNYELLITEADRIASGHERMKADETADYDVGGTERKSKVPLISILSRIQLEGKPYSLQQEDWRYKLRPIVNLFSREKLEELFPCRPDLYEAYEVEKDYKVIWQEFKQAITAQRDGKFLDLFDNFETLFEICQEHMWCLPASTRKEEIPDVSLFEHCKTTAALAACLYCFHALDNGNIDQSTEEETNIKDRSLRKFLLFCGDISGIQKFVYQISSKGAYKALKGRSFLIQLLSELIARRLISEFNLCVPNILYASGGKSYLLLPNTEKVKSGIKKVSEALNEELFRKYSGDLYVRTAYRALSGEDLTRQSGKTLYDIWDRLTRDVALVDRKKYQHLANNDYELLFGVNSYFPETCEVCHRSIKEKGKCRICNEMEEMGRLLGKASYVVIANETNTVINERHVFSLKKVFNEDIYVWILPQLNADEFTRGKSLVLTLDESRYEKIPLEFPHPEKVNSSLFILGSNHSFDATFEDIASRSKGIKRLGILRMDVDDLGKIFSQGLKKYRHEVISDERFYSLGRITTLSFQLNLFFGGIIPRIISRNERFSERVTVVYSGGDDLFILGAWDAIPRVAKIIREKFHRFSCNNTRFGLSAGIVITGGKFPIYKGAELAGDAETKAKRNVYKVANGKTIKKDSITFLDQPASWLEFNEIFVLYESLQTLLLDKRYHPLIGRLRQISYLWDREKLLLKDKTKLNLQEIENKLMAEKWRWRMVYGLSRFADRYPNIADIVDTIQKFTVGTMKGTKRYGIEFLGLLSRWLELELRGEKER